MGMSTARGYTWNAQRVRRYRWEYGLPSCHNATDRDEFLTLTEAAGKLRVNHHVVRRLIRQGVLPAQQASREGALAHPMQPICCKKKLQMPWQGPKVSRVKIIPFQNSQYSQTVQKATHNENHSIIPATRTATDASCAPSRVNTHGSRRKWWLAFPSCRTCTVSDYFPPCFR